MTSEKSGQEDLNLRPHGPEPRLTPLCQFPFAREKQGICAHFTGKNQDCKGIAKTLGICKVLQPIWVIYPIIQTCPRHVSAELPLSRKQSTSSPLDDANLAADIK